MSSTSRLAASAATTIMKAANFRGLQEGRTASVGTFWVRFIPCGVASKAQEIYSARANPTARITTSTLTAEVIADVNPKGKLGQVSIEQLSEAFFISDDDEEERKIITNRIRSFLKENRERFDTH